MKAALHRFAQGISALFAFARRPDTDLARRHLSACEYDEFSAMSKADQLHSLNVLRKLLAADPRAPKALISAALLHDVGKSRYHLSVWQKTLAVIIEAIAPGLSHRLSDERSISFWRAPFIVRRHHAKWSGEILRNCGSAADAVWLVARHQEDANRYRDCPLYALLQSLQTADDDC